MIDRVIQELLFDPCIAMVTANVYLEASFLFEPFCAMALLVRISKNCQNLACIGSCTSSRCGLFLRSA